MNEDSETQPDNTSREPSFWQVVMSTLAAALGVQNSANRERDFTHGNPLVFIAAGLIFTVVFVLTIGVIGGNVFGRWTGWL